MSDAVSEIAIEAIPIRTLAALTGVRPITLRAWERRYGLVQPLRTITGHRLYTHEHVDRIRRVVKLIERGISIGQVRQLLDAQAGAHSSADRVGGVWRGYLDRLSAAVARFDTEELERAYDEALSLYPIEEVTHRLLMPLLAQLGERWRDVSGGVAEEHFFATYLRSKLGARLRHRMRYATGPRLLLACAPGEQHEIGLLLFALEAQNASFRTVILGADTPFEELAIAQHRSDSSAVVISSSIDPPQGLLEQSLPELVRQSTTTPVFVGGATAVRHGPAIAAAGAVPLGTDLENGVRLVAARLKEMRPDA